MRSTITRLAAGALSLGLLTGPAFAPRAQAAADPYFVGAIVSESGPGASLGRPEADSIELAVSEINAAGGVGGHPLTVQILDDESNPTTAVSDTRQLLDKHPVAILARR